MSKWSEYYHGRAGDSYPDYCLTKYSALFEALAGMIDSGMTNLREEGCGIASISKALCWIRPEITIEARDICKDQLSLAAQNVAELPQITLRKDSILSRHSMDSRTDVIYSHGVLEHFDDQQINYILYRQRSQAKRVVHYVPTNQYDSPSFGCERLMPASWWVDRWEPDWVIEQNDGRDLVLIWEGNNNGE